MRVSGPNRARSWANPSHCDNGKRRQRTHDRVLKAMLASARYENPRQSSQARDQKCETRETEKIRAEHVAGSAGNAPLNPVPQNPGRKEPLRDLVVEAHERVHGSRCRQQGVPVIDQRGAADREARRDHPGREQQDRERRCQNTRPRHGPPKGCRRVHVRESLDTGGYRLESNSTAPERISCCNEPRRARFLGATPAAKERSWTRTTPCCSCILSRCSSGSVRPP